MEHTGGLGQTTGERPRALRRWRLGGLAALLAALLLAACAPAGPAPAAPKTLADAPRPRWSVGDTWQFDAPNRCPFTLGKKMTVTEAGAALVLTGDGASGKFLRLDPRDLSVLESKGGEVEYKVLSGADPYLFFPLAVGQKRTFSQAALSGGATRYYTTEVAVEAVEEVEVPAGRFTAFRIRVTKMSATGWVGAYRLWYAPEVRYFVRIMDPYDGDALLSRYSLKEPN